MGTFISSFGRLWKAAFRDMNRHFSVVFSSVVTIAVALLLGSLLLIAALNAGVMADSVEQEVRVQASLSPALSTTRTAEVVEKLGEIDGVSAVEFRTKEQELEELARENASVFSQYEGENNPLYDIAILQLQPGANLDSVREQALSISGVSDLESGGRSIDSLTSVFSHVRTVGFLLTAGLFVLAVFLVQSAVRMTVAVREDEITIMRQVGAANWYIRLPFIYQGLVTGLAGALIPVLIVAGGYPLLYNVTGGHLGSDMLPLVAPQPMLGWLCAGLFGAGILLGVLGAWSGTSRLLKEAR